METLALLGTVLGIGFVSGINLYATVLAIGVAIRFGLITLDPAYESLAILGDPIVIGAAGLMYVCEFVADKVPWFDSFWDVIHTAIRPVGAAVLASMAVGSVDPATEIAAILLSGTVALTSHSVKAGTRVLANHSPEPFSNIALSLFEDVLAFGGTVLLLMNPILMLVLVVAFIGVFIWLFPKLVRLLRSSLRKVAGWFRKRPAESVPQNALPQ